jgi:hypothetical protein
MSETHDADSGLRFYRDEELFDYAAEDRLFAANR